ncbi:MAG TPA: HIT family protein [Actinomycetota bacterium]|nr:HIT family protein [Actinomycetota bacterium]
MADDCIFCRIAAGEAPANKIYENDSVFAIMDIFPWTEGHCLVIPKTHAPTLFDISPEDAAAVVKAARHLAPALRDAVGADGLNLLQSNGRAAWQQVDHFHLHLIPRWADDSLVQPISPAAGDMDAIEATAARILEALG